ncbi:sensor histidine kinase [Pseudonocardia sp. N23]|uniref:sensor histidine kinase n=1 Tax=Pseudonocardia sp. N23 TaxID=1987376 RepID=UPI000BFE694E|nr:histidine kinase [Pseudonocardia sp. N23]GAY09022.1 two-component system sensor kinase [Pseudonocardia sp. N23]
MIGGTGGAGRLRAMRWAGLAVEVAGYLVWLAVDCLTAVSYGLPWGAVTPIAGVCVAVVVLLRRRPGADARHVAVVTYLVSAVATLAGLLVQAPSMSFGEQLALAVVTIAALRHADDRTAVLLVLAAGIVIVASPYLRVEVPTNVATYTILSALGWGGTVAIGLVLREAGSRRASLLERARADERLELARELHDVVAHQVTGIVVAAQSARVVAPADPDVAKALAAIETAGADALAAMRAMVGVLRGGEGGRAPGAELGGIPEMVRRFDPDGTRVRLLADPGFEHAVLPAGVAATGYRVVQEALTNVRRHAPGATRVEVEVRLRADELVVGVRNDGAGSGSSTSPGFGLAGMAERVGALDGTLHAGPAGNGVWTVTARLPVGGR